MSGKRMQISGSGVVREWLDGVDWEERARALEELINEFGLCHPDMQVARMGVRQAREMQWDRSVERAKKLMRSWK